MDTINPINDARVSNCYAQLNGNNYRKPAPLPMTLMHPTNKMPPDYLLGVPSAPAGHTATIFLVKLIASFSHSTKQLINYSKRSSTYLRTPYFLVWPKSSDEGCEGNTLDTCSRLDGPPSNLSLGNTDGGLSVQWVARPLLRLAQPDPRISRHGLQSHLSRPHGFRPHRRSSNHSSIGHGLLQLQARCRRYQRASQTTGL